MAAVSFLSIRVMCAFCKGFWFDFIVHNVGVESKLGLHGCTHATSKFMCAANPQNVPGNVGKLSDIKI